MFYSQFILARKGPLGTIWIAAHLERKLRKNQVADTDIGVSVDSILFPEVPIALRLSSHLLLGVVRIYSRKVNYLFDDCSEALLKIKQAFRSTAVDLPPEESTAPYHSITLPETFDLDDFELPDGDIFQGNFVDHHVSTREQITLQDTMEGVVYSTSQFGLDERFGDGDASGLDLDEELFLDKVAAPEHAGVILGSDADPQASDQAMTTLKQDENCGMTENSEAMLATAHVNQIEVPTHDTDLVEYAQAPCTPGLVEPPNLCDIQEASACDDHLDSEDHNLTELATKENLESVTSKSGLHCGNKNAVDWSLLKDMNPDPVRCMPPEENGGLLDAQEIQKLMAPGDLSSTAVNIEHTSSEACHSGSLPSSVVTDPNKFTSPVSEFSDRSIFASDGANRLEDLPNGVVRKDSVTHSIDGAYLDCVPQRISLDENEGPPSVSHEIPAMETSDGNQGSGIEHALEKSNLISTCQPVPEDTSEINQASHKHEVSNNRDIAENVEKSSPHSSVAASSAEAPFMANFENPETQACQEPKDSIMNTGVHDEMASTHVHVLQPCNLHLNQPNLLNLGGENSVVTDLPSRVGGQCSTETSGRKEAPYASEASMEVPGERRHSEVTSQVIERDNVAEIGSCEHIQSDLVEVDDQICNGVSRDTQLENLGTSDACELPAPEKLLSVPDGFTDLPGNLLESTPDKALSMADDISGSRIKTVSGRKRSFMESMQTVQSLDSAESFGVALSKRTGEYIPDDDDLLSSILVGRRSSVLKVKPTPPLITSSKRPRPASRVSAKRKVLMDDNMVLHGDTIRQQLTSTEDIRRLRKKAPCTHREIWMLQAQLLEDEIFSEPLHTGSSAELVYLHCGTYDLGKIKVSQNEENNTSLEAANDMMFPVGLNITKEAGSENTEPVVVRNDEEATPAETPLQTLNQQGEGHALNCQDNHARVQDTCDLTEPKSSQHEHFGDGAEMHVDGGVSVVDAVNPSATFAVEQLSLSDHVLDDISNMPAGSMVQPATWDKNSCPDASLQLHASGMSPVENLDTQSIEMDDAVVGMKDGNGCESIVVAGMDDYNVAAVVSEPRTRDEFMMEEIENHASVEIKADIDTDCSMDNKNSNPSLITSPKTSGCDNQVVTDDHALEETSKNNQVEDEDEFLVADLGNDDKNQTANGICSEEPKIDSYQMELIEDVTNASLNDGYYPSCQQTDQQSFLDAETGLIDHTASEYRSDFDYSINEHDTGFLNVDDEDAEENDDYMPSAEETRFLENSGWSSRTRAVAKYLQTLFDKEAENGRKVIPMDNLLAGKTRKEASRMFFESLVLKTRDYIHVEQETPFYNINIKPRVKLMKSDF